MPQKSPVTAIIAVITAVMIVAVIAYNVTAPFITPPPPPATPGNTAAGLDRNTERLRSELDAVYASGEAREVSLSLTESESNEAAAWIIVNSGTSPMRITGVVVDLQPGNTISVNLFAVTFGIAYRLEVAMSLGISNGKPDVRVKSVDAPLLLAPYRDTIARLVRDKTWELLRKLSGSGPGYEGRAEFRLTGIKTDGDSLMLEGTAKAVR